MDWDDAFMLFLVLIMVSVVVTIGVFMVRDGQANTLCVSQGHDSGNILFWKNEVVCKDIIQTEKIELTCIPAPCR